MLFDVQRLVHDKYVFLYLNMMVCNLRSVLYEEYAVLKHSLINSVIQHIPGFIKRLRNQIYDKKS